MNNTTDTPIFRLDKYSFENSIICVKNPIIPLYPAHSHTFYELTYYPAWSGILNINSVAQRNDVPLAVMVTPADFHSITKTDNATPNIQFAFSGDLLPNREILPESAIVLECQENSEYIRSLFEELFENADNIKYATYLISAVILKLRLCGQTVIPTFNDSKYQLVAKAIKYINGNFCKNISLTDVAYELHISPQYLSTVFSKNLGINFSTYLTKLRLKYSTELLLEKNLSITEISFLCGYQNISHFLRSFKKEFGLTPGEYRKKGGSPQ